jgi:hypothetical protein
VDAKLNGKKAPKQIMTIRVGEFDPVTLAPNNIPMSEKVIVRKATGMPFEAFLGDEDKIGADSVAIMWWLARRANGEPMLTWSQVEKDWPDELTESDIDVEVDDPSEDASDPEA